MLEEMILIVLNFVIALFLSAFLTFALDDPPALGP